MKYRGFEIIPSYFVGSDIRTNKNGEIMYHPNGEIKLRKPTKKDIEYYEIYEPGVPQRWAADFTIKAARETIDGWLQ